jgi:hypothetical protein
MKDATDPWVYNIDLAQWQSAWNLVNSVPVTINMTQDVDMSTTLQQIINEINKQYGSNGNASTKLAELLNDVASLGNIDNKINASIDDAKADIKSQINSLITRANNKLTGWFNRLPGFLNLALVGGKDNNIGLLSQSKKLPTQASGSLKLVPTTYSLELLAPAYKKLVVVSDVFNADGTEVDTTKTDKRVTVNGVLGLYIQSKINGARLFFACSGYGFGSTWYYRGSLGYYWSASFGSSRNARSLCFFSGGVNAQFNNSRYSGFAVRAVQ